MAWVRIRIATAPTLTSTSCYAPSNFSSLRAVADCDLNGQREDSLRKNVASHFESTGHRTAGAGYRGVLSSYVVASLMTLWADRENKSHRKVKVSLTSCSLFPQFWEFSEESAHFVKFGSAESVGEIVWHVHLA